MLVAYDWLPLLNLLQDVPFYKRVRVLLTARDSFVSDRLRNLSGMEWKPVRIEVGRYDMNRNGAFDAKLSAAGISREELPESVLELASVPRFFDLVVGLRSKLGNVDSVTVHHLLWEHGASTFTASAFGAYGWNELVLNLAKEFRDGSLEPTRTQVENLSGSAATHADQVYRRVSIVVDSVFARLSDYGELEFEPDFVRYALGLALVKALEKETEESARSELERFLQPISDYDERAEIIRAAVSIALARKWEERPNVLLGVLCCSWVQSQNLPQSHVTELRMLASRLVEPLLDAVERTGGHGSSSARYIAVNALCNLDRSNRTVARAIASRGAQWFRLISQERSENTKDNDENSAYARRRKRLKSRIGTSEVGRRIVLGREVKILENTDGGLHVAIAQLMQGRPLAEGIELLEASALHQAITVETQEEISWLTILNSVDPAETAMELRARSEIMASRAPEAGVHADLNSKVAAILLRRTGYEEDLARALQVDPGLDGWPSYEEDYLKDPAMSFFRLERRHAAETLLRKDMALVPRIRRAKEFFLDPTMSVPDEFTREVVAAARSLDFDKMAPGRSRSREDWDWRIYSLALARCAPDELARLERARLKDFAQRSGERRYGASIAALDSILLIGDDERCALRSLRCRKPETPTNSEWMTQTNLLMAEFLGMPPVEQFQQISDVELDGVGMSFTKVCATPSSDDLDELVKLSGSSPEHLSKIASVFGEKPVSVSGYAFDQLVRVLDSELEDAALGAVWVMLGLNAPERLGAVLEKKGWCWSADRSDIENRMGSRALAAKNRETAFADFAEQLAPAELLGALSIRDCLREDVALAIKLLNSVVQDTRIKPPETQIDVWHDRNSAERMEQYLYTAGSLREENAGADDLRGVLRRMRSPEQYEERRQEIATRYFERVKEARRVGAQFHLWMVTPAQFDIVFKLCPEAIDAWLQGMSDGTTVFARRVVLANGFFVPLCEAMLRHMPERGLALWRALRANLTNPSFVVNGDMDLLVQALFSAGRCEIVDEALDEICALDESNSDEELLNIVVGARANDRLEWLREKVARDAKSACPLAKRRAAYLEPLLMVPEIAADEDWPEEQFGGGVREQAWKLAQREAFARHWLHSFVDAESPEAAHACWRLFLACADRRVWSWMGDVLGYDLAGDTGWEDTKKRFADMQSMRLRHEMSRNERDWAKEYTRWRYPRDLWPWNKGG